MKTDPEGNNTYRFKIYHQALGNQSDFNDILQAYAQNRGIIHWLDLDVPLNPTYSCVARKRKDSNYSLIKTHQYELNRYIQSQDAKTFLIQNYTLLDSNLSKVLTLINTTFKAPFQLKNQEFIAIEELFSSHQNNHQHQNNQETENISLRDLCYKEGKKYYSIALQREYVHIKAVVGQTIEQKCLIIDPQNEQFYYSFTILIRSELRDVEELIKESSEYDFIDDGIQQLVIDIKIQDEQQFLQKQLKLPKETNPFSNRYLKCNPFYPTGRIRIPFREDQSKRNKLIEEKHYSLAFQGGGAKGLAYVGAYKALKENYKLINGKKKRVPITSIIGSSAGGMIAMAVSTGISHRQLKKICYKMMEIPLVDSIKSTTFKDQKPIKQLTTAKVFQNIKQMLHEYGILHKTSFENIQNVIEEYLPQINRDLLNLLTSDNPTLASIITGEKQTLNLEGLFVHGALMTGKSIHNIAAECLIRYFMKKYYQHQKQELRTFLDDCFSTYRHKDINDPDTNNSSIAGILITCLENYHSLSRDILNIPLTSLKKNYPNFCQIMTSAINSLILLVSQYEQEMENEQSQKDIKSKEPSPLNSRQKLTAKLSVEKQQQDFKNMDEDVAESFEWSILNKIFKLKQFQTLQSIFRDSPISQERYLKVKSVRDLLKLISNYHKTNNRTEYIKLLERQHQIKLLHPDLFDINQEESQDTIRDLFQELLSSNYPQYFNQADYFSSALNISGSPDKLTQFELELAEIIINAFQDNLAPHQQPPAPIQQFLNNKNQFQKQVGTINMIEYYILTSVELTCTSVDLDDKTLRLFNKKTTPFLPVCSAVQMSGSFPGAFKALKWDQSWGKYTIFFDYSRIEKDLTGHEFTDGGLLANFPIKYLDNADICNLYFSHIPREENTIILGFGLDHLTQYEPNMKESLEILKKQQLTEAKDSKNSEFLQSLGFFQKCKLLATALDELFTDKSKEEKQTNWSDINHAILQQIPLLRFMLKILDAYPNADRNFNVESFANKVLHQNLYPKWKNKFVLYEQQQQIISQHLVSLRNILKQIQDRTYTPLQQLKELPLETYRDASNEIALIIDTCRNSQQNIKDKIRIQQNVIRGLYTQKQHFIVKNDPQFDLKNPQHQQQLVEKMVRRLVNIFIVLLREAPEKIKIALSEEYVRLKYPKTYKKIASPLEYDVSENEKRMVHYLYLHLNSEHPHLSAQQLSEKITTKGYENIYKEAVQNKDKQERCFNYHHIYHVFISISKQICEHLQHQPLTHEQNNVKYLLWKQLLTDFLTKINQDKQQHTRFYWKDYFNQSFFIKNEDLNQNEQKDYKLKDPAELLYTSSFADTNSLKSIFTYQAEHVYSKQKNKLDQLLLQQLAKTPLHYIHNYLQTNPNPEIKSLINEQNKYALIKLIRTLTYRKKDKIKGKDRFSITEQKQLEKNILDIFFGTKRHKLTEFKNMKKELSATAQEEIKRNDEFLEDIAKLPLSNQIKMVTESYFLRFLQMNVLFFAVAHKIISTPSQDQPQMVQKYAPFVRDFKFIFHSLEEITAILYALCFDMELSQETLIHPDDSSKQTYLDKLTKILSILQQLYSDFITEYKQLSNLPNNSLTLSQLEETFIIKHSLIKTTLTQIHAPLKYKYLALECNPDPCPKKTIQKKYLKYINDAFDRILYYKPALPLFEIDWKLVLKSHNLLFIHNNQPYSFKSTLVESFEDMLARQSDNKKKASSGKIKMSEEKGKIHLILEGVGISNQYFCAFYQILEDIFTSLQKNNQEPKKNIKQQPKNTVSIIEQNLPTDDRLTIKSTPFRLSSVDNLAQPEDNIQAITSSNYHSVFGFLLATKIPFEQVRKQTYRLRRLTNNLFDYDKISNYFSSYQFLGECTNQYKQLVQYLEHQRRQFFSQFQKLKNKDYLKNSLLDQYNDVRALMDNENGNFTTIYQKILEQISTQVAVVDGEIKPVLQPKEICKKFAFDYIEEVEQKKMYQYAQINQQAFQDFKNLVHIIYESLGSLLEAVLCNIATEYSTISIDQKNSSLVAKGVIVKRLLNTFKLKQYVMDKLKDMHLSPSITLAKFYESAPRTLLLNFCVINITEQRLEFFNKFTMPYMPLWAAVVASASLPFLFNYFPVPHEWEGVEQKSTFYNLIVDNFFKEQVQNNRQITEYCSSNYISSLPMELLTNNTVNKKLGQLKNLKEIAIAFTDKEKNGPESLKIKKKFVNLKPFLTLFTKYKFKTLKQKINLSNLFNTIRGRKPTPVDVNYGSYFVQCLSNVANIKKTLQTLVDSNDNFILQWYQDKLIRLPIKIGTLDFHEIVDSEVYSKYKVKILSEKAKQTVQRSYEITKSFTNYLTLPQSEQDKQRYKIKLRLQVLYKQDENDLVHKFFKINLLNHSKWNKNRFNNFLIYHRIKQEQENPFKRAIDSEIQWNIENGEKIEIIVYFPHFPREHNKPLQLFSHENLNNRYFGTQTTLQDTEQKMKNDLACLYYTHWLFDFSQVIQKLNNYNESGVTDADTFDYIFDYSKMPKQTSTIELPRGEPFTSGLSKVILLKAVSVNKMSIFSPVFNPPKLIVSLIEDSSGQQIFSKKKTIQKFYIKQFPLRKDEQESNN